MIETINPTRLIEDPLQLRASEIGDRISTQGLLEHLLNSKVPNLPDEIVLSKKDNVIITTNKNCQGEIFERFYRVLNGKLIEINSKTIHRLSPKHWKYKKITGRYEK